MPRDTRKRIKLTFNAEQYRKATRVRKALFPYPLESAGFRDVLMYLHDNLDAIRDFVTSGAQKAPEGPKGAQKAPAVPCPDPAPAREHSPREKESERVRGDELADHWQAVEPFCLLPAPVTTLAAMRRAYPGRDLEAETAKIELWWMERPAPKGKKRKKGERWFVSGIQAGIRGWLGRAGEPLDHPAKPTQGSLAGLTEADWTAGCDDDGITHA